MEKTKTLNKCGINKLKKKSMYNTITLAVPTTATGVFSCGTINMLKYALNFYNNLKIVFSYTIRKR